MSFEEIESIEQLESAIEHEDALMVVFSKEQCPACDNMSMWLDKRYETEVEMQQKSPVKVVLAKLERLGRNVVDSFGLRTVPTTLLFKGGDEVYRVAGFQGPQPVVNAIQSNFNTV